MPDKTKGRRTTLGRKDLIGLLRDAEFFAACPRLASLLPSAIDATAQLKALGKKACCGRDWRVVGPVVNALHDSLLEAKRAKDETVERFRDYLSHKKHYRVGKIVLFYRSESKGPPRRLEL